MILSFSHCEEVHVNITAALITSRQITNRSCPAQSMTMRTSTTTTTTPKTDPIKGLTIMTTTEIQREHQRRAMHSSYLRQTSSSPSVYTETNRFTSKPEHIGRFVGEPLADFSTNNCFAIQVDTGYQQRGKACSCEVSLLLKCDSAFARASSTVTVQVPIASWTQNLNEEKPPSRHLL